MFLDQVFYPLRRLHGLLADFQRRNELHKYIRGVKVCVLGTPTHKNVGDCAIAVAQQLFLQKCGFKEESIKEVTLEEYNHYYKYLRRWISKEVLITQIGGGNLGNQWMAEEELHRKITMDFSANPMIIFPQTIYYTNGEFGNAEQKKSVSVYNKAGAFTLFAREKKSKQIMEELYPKANISIAPDIVLSTGMDDYGVTVQSRKGALLCMRSDAERLLTPQDIEFLENLLRSKGFSVAFTDMYSELKVTKWNRKQVVRQKMEEFARAELVVTDRLHGMIFAAIMGTPCIVLSNYNHKVMGTYEWIRYLPYIRFAESIEDVRECMEEISCKNGYQYDSSPLRPHFDKLAQAVARYSKIQNT